MARASEQLLLRELVLVVDHALLLVLHLHLGADDLDAGHGAGVLHRARAGGEGLGGPLLGADGLHAARGGDGLEVEAGNGHDDLLADVLVGIPRRGLRRRSGAGVLDGAVVKQGLSQGNRAGPTR